MKVAHVITGLGFGGAERELARVIRHSQCDVEVLGLSGQGAVGDELARIGVPVHVVRMRRNTDLSALAPIVRFVRRFDVVHLHLFRAIVYGRVAAALAGCRRVVTTEHSLGETQIEGRPISPGVRALYLGTEPLSEVTIAVSNAVRRRLVALGVPAGKIVVVPNGVDAAELGFRQGDRVAARRELGIPESAFVAGTVGRLEPLKGLDLMLEAAAPLLGTDDRLLLVGEGSEREALERLTARLGIKDNVVFTGARADIARMLATMDAFVSASSEETFGVSVVEALAGGLPVVVTTCPALEGEDVPNVTWSVRSIAGLRTALAGQWRARRPERRPPAVVTRRFAIERVAAGIDAVYEGVVAGNRR